MTLLKIHIPKPANNAAKATEHVKEQMCNEFGGCTAYDAQGSWKSENETDWRGNAVMTESVTVIETYTSMSESVANGIMHDLAEYVKEETQELSVAFVVNQDMYFKE